MKKYHHTIKSGIVQDVLTSLAENPLPDSYVGGGMSLQFTLPSEYHRSTSDIDLASSQPITFVDFKNYLMGCFNSLSNQGYALDVRKSHLTLDAHIERGTDHLMVQVPRRAKKKFEQLRSTLKREVEHARQVSYGGLFLKVISYEDLLAHKLARSSAFVKEYCLRLPDGTLGSLKEQLDGVKEDFAITQFSMSPEEARHQLAQIRLCADVFDIKAVMENFFHEIDEDYLEEALRSYTSTEDRVSIWDWKLLLDRIAA